METDLVKTRIVSFGWSALSLFVVAIAGVLASNDFRTLIFQHFGNTFYTSLALLFIPEIVKHLRNLAVTRKLGSRRDSVILI